jgi:hypothetical protein
MQTVARLELHKVWHGRSAEMRARRFPTLSHIHVRLYHCPTGVHVIAVETGSMIRIFTDYVESPRGRPISFPPGGNMGCRHFITASPENRLLVV